MRSNNLKTTMKTALLAASVLLLGAGSAVAQQVVNLAAGATTLTTPDGSLVQMWGYTCGTVVTGSTATCAKSNPAAAGWSPVVIKIPTGQGLTINLTNNLTFASGSSVPTSLVIVGQLGGGLGNSATSTTSPDHTNAQTTVTWPIANPGGGTGTPPTQGNRVQSFATEVLAGATTALTWPAATLRPGTYLIESGTHPSIQGPMGLYGILVVTTAPVGTTAGTAYPAVGTTPAVTYNADAPLLLSEIDPVQNAAVSAAVNTAGFSETTVWSGQPGGCGNPSTPNYGNCYPPAVNYTPLFYLINGVAFDKTHPTPSLFPTAPATGVTGTVLVRIVNAGLRMHVPSIVGTLTNGFNPTGSAAAVVPGFSLIAEDGNRLPGLARVQSEVFMAAGKTYDVMINVPAAGGTAVPIFDRELSLSGNKIGRDGGMLAYISINGSTLPGSGTIGTAVARADAYPSLVSCAATPCPAFAVADPSKGVIANDTNVYGVELLAPPTNGTVTLNPDGTFSYVPNGTGATPDSFTYCANGSVTAGVCSSGLTAAVALNVAALEAASGITVNNMAYTATMATYLKIVNPGILSVDKDAAGYPLTVTATSVTPAAGLTLSVDPNGGFVATVPTCTTTPAGCIYTFTYKAQNSQGTVSTNAATVTLTFPPATNLAVTVKDGANKTTVITDYRWIIEEDRTFYLDPACTTNPPPAGCPSAAGGIVPTFGTNFHTSYMPVVAAGCTGVNSCETFQTVLDPASGQHLNAVCDIGNGICRTTALSETVERPNVVHLDPTRHYYITVLPGDAANPFEAGNLTNSCANGGNSASCGHGMGGAPVIPTCTSAGVCTFPPVTIYTQPTPFPPSKLSVFVFEDDFPLNGENDAGGGTLGPNPDLGLPANEPGLGGFNVVLFDDAGGTGDATGQMTYDMFNQPLANSLAGTIDPATGLDACPITTNPLNAGDGSTDPTATGLTGTIVTCPRFEADGTTFSPLAGQVVVVNLMPGRYGVVATPGADHIAHGEEWLQTNTLDGQKAHDSFLRIGEPAYFQEFGPAGYHVSIGFANPKIINSRHGDVCPAGTTCTASVTGRVTTIRMSRTPDERLYSSGSYDSFSFTQCYVSLGDPDGEDFAFTKCNADGTFTLANLPAGSWRLTVFDQWNDMLVDGLSTPVPLTNGATLNMGDIATNQWQANIYTSTFFDADGNGVRGPTEAGLSLVSTNVRFRDGSFSNFNNTDLSGNAGFNEEFPLFSWYVVEADTTRYKNTGTHVVYDAGGPTDGTCGTGTAPCGNSNIAQFMANTAEQISVPTALRVPGAVYCAGADCTGNSIAVPSTSAPSPCVAGGASGVTCGGSPISTGRIDPPWVETEGWQGYSGQNSFLEFGKKPFEPNETGGIHGHVIYASTRPFDDPTLLLQLSWEPLVPGVTINLYQEGAAADKVTPTLKLVDSTKTSSFDDWAQGFRSDGVPNMNCPGQFGAPTTTAAGDIFYFSLFNQPQYLDTYNAQHNGGTLHTVPDNSQFKCYDGMHNWNQLQPAPYDGKYEFPSIAGRNPTTGVPTGGTGSVAGTNCTICVANPTDGTPMLPAGKYVVEIIVPPNYELVKEEDKNILIGDNFIAPVTQEFPGLGSAIYILPDQAQVGATYNPNNGQNSTQGLGRTTFPSSEGDTGEVEVYWPCVGASRIVPDYISLFPNSAEVAPFAGASRNLCDRKEVTLDNQASVLAKFYIFTSTHVAAHYTGVITDDFTSEFDPFSPQFGEKFAPPDLPISVKDWSGNEISRVYTDHWGAYNGLTYSTWEVNPPNPTGYSPTMMVTCMNDPGPILDTRPTIVNSAGATVANPTLGQMITDPLYNASYSQFCYEIPFMPGQTQYMDTPVVPTAGFTGAGYNNPDCAYPDATPAVKEVNGAGEGPWVAAVGATLTINALGDSLVNNNAYSGPSATTAPYNQKFITRHYGFGATQGTGSVTIGGVSAPVTSWSDAQITVTVPTIPAASSTCPIQQQAQYGGPGTTGVSTAVCGELVVTAGNGKQSVDAVTVTVGGKTPTHVAATASIQAAIDAAKPGDMLIIDPTCTNTAGTGVACSTAGSIHTTGAHTEMLLMWKPVRLQGVGAASSLINANPHPAGKLDPWRRQVNCLFGLALNGTPLSGANPYDPKGKFTCTSAMQFAVDRIDLEAIVGWDANLNGNLPEQISEPSLMGAYEGAGITVLGKGVKFSNPTDIVSNLAEQMPADAVVLKATDCGPNTTTAKNPYPSNFWCNPARIDGMSVTNSSQGGGGIFVHSWGHNLEISNNRVNSNSGTLAGGISVGQGEFPPQLLQGSATNASPGSCQTSTVANRQLPYCLDLNVNVHNNAITSNSSLGDELFSATNSGAGGINFCTGSDFYKFNYNWVCGNLSTGDGGGVVHMGFSWNGDIEHNTILFNQSTNPTIPTNGGGIAVLGAPDTDPVCGVDVGPTADADCAPGTSDGTGPGLVINANLIMGNAADSGSGGGIRLHGVNGTEVTFFPSTPVNWYSVNITNNIIANNVAGWDGAGISIQDALATNLINNTIIDNDSTASAGILFNTLGAPLSSSPGSSCIQAGGTTASCPQPSGVVATQNSPTLDTTLSAYTLTCPAGHFAGATATNGTCKAFSYPILANNVIWKNRSFYIGVGGPGAGTLNQQNVVALFNSVSNSAVAPQPQGDATTPNGTGVIITGGSGACVPGVSYWDVGVRGDSGPTNHASGLTLAPMYSVLTSLGGTAEYSAATLHNTAADPTVLSQYCNGSRIPPELGSAGYIVPPGIADATVPNPPFNLTPSATVDEGNNWVNVSWGPLAESNPVSGTLLANYGPASTSSVINYIPAAATTYAEAPSLDFYSHSRKLNNAVDAGAVEFQSPAGVPTLTSIAPASGFRGTTVNVTLTGTNFVAGSTVAISGTNITIGPVTVVSATSITTSFIIAAAAGTGARNVTVTTPGGVTGAVVFTVNAPAAAVLTSITPNTGVRGTVVPVTLSGTGLTGTSAITVTGATGITVSALTVVNDTTVTATFTITTAATVGAHTVSVTTAGGISNTVAFTVQGPTLTSIAPTFGSRGTTVPVTLTGTNLAGATSITVSGTGVTCTITGTPTATTVTGNCVITNAAGTGNRNVAVVTATLGTTGTVTFAVHSGTAVFAGPTPALTTATPDTTTKTGTITVSNSATGATAGPITLTAAPAITKVGTAGGTFSIIAGGTCVSGFVISPAPTATSCTINVQYAPGGSTATATANVTIPDTGAGSAAQTSANFTAN
jgi:Bacterial Ig domain